jgi:hypothetical protein
MKLNEIAQPTRSRYEDDEGYFDHEEQDMDIDRVVQSIELDLSERLGREVRLTDEQYRVVVQNLETMDYEELVNEFLRDIQWSENER